VMGDGLTRLLVQASVYAPLTRRFLIDAGIAPAMRVLDVGSGGGDVAFIAAELVGPDGCVVGIEGLPERAEAAQERARAAGHSHVSFVAANIDTLQAPGEFDAIIGRFVLRELRDPAAALRRLSEGLVAGGVVAFQEKILSQPVVSFPTSPALATLVGWMDEARREGGVELAMGAKLPALFEDAGFARPSVRIESPIGVGGDWVGIDYLVEAARGMLPLFDIFEIAEAAEVDLDAARAAVRRELGDVGVVVLSPVVGACSRAARAD